MVGCHPEVYWMVRLYAMGDQTTDEHVVAAINAVRTRHHACTVGALADELGLGRSTVIYHLNRLVAAGRVTRSSLAGSIAVVGGVE